MARVQVNTIGSRKSLSLAPTKAWVFLYRLEKADNPTIFCNMLLAGEVKYIGGGTTEGYCVLWCEQGEKYHAMLSGILGQISRKGIKSVTLQHPSHMDDLLLGMSQEKVVEYGVILAKMLVLRFDKLVVRLSFQKDDKIFPRLIKNAVQTTKGILVEA